ncbi:MAG: hypothetical protein LBE78_00755 [Burkholderiaceae bacterium]|jgi:hypothetical protein|nr:hypothetical protein [Burkholderiaceae bacterium]
MINTQYTIDLFDDLYSEGDIDIIFFAQILGMVSYGKDDFKFNKSSEKRMADALKLVDYLVSLGDFNVGKTLKMPDGTFAYNTYKEGFSEFYADANKIYSKNGIDDIDLMCSLWLKKLHIGQSAPIIPNEIMKLFEPGRLG